MKKYSLFTLLFFSIIISFGQNEINLNKDSKNSKEVPFDVIEDVPIYSGCDANKTSEERKKCTSNKIAEFINKNFNSNIISNLNLPPGKKNIIVHFKINKIGEVTDVSARSDYKELENEAIRVVKSIPDFDRPGMFLGNPVIVPYALPITFNLEDKKTTTYPAHKRCAKIIDNELLKKCTQEKISDFIKLSVNYELADKLFPQDKSTQFKVFFTVDKKGNIKDITAKAHHREMAKEVIRVLKKLPKFKKPAMNNGTPADFKYSYLLTIYF